MNVRVDTSRDGMDMGRNGGKSERESLKPMGLLIILIASIFASAAFVDLSFSIIPPLSMSMVAFLHAGMLVVMLFPIVYFLIFDPLKSQIRELEQSEEALRMREEKYRCLIESTDDSVYLLNRNCEYLFMNTRHRWRMGFVGDEYLGRAFGEFHSPLVTKIFGEEVSKVFETGKSSQHEHRSDRDGRHFLRTLSPVRALNGEITAVSVISKNVGTLKRTGVMNEYSSAGLV